MRQVTREEFFAPIYAEGLDVHPTIISRFPYSSEWRFPRKLGEPLYGKTVETIEKAEIITAYFIS